MKVKKFFSSNSTKTFSTILMVVFLVIVAIMSGTNAFFLTHDNLFFSDVDIDLGVEENYITPAYSNITAIVVVTISAVMILTSILCLISTIRNTKSENKKIKIINRVLTFCFIAAIVWGIAAIGLLKG